MNKNLIALLAVPFISFSALAAHQDLVKFGDTAQIALPITAGVISLYQQDYEGVGQLVEGAIYTAAITQGLKYSIDAKRPNGKPHSFPSGHTSAASQAAAYLQFRYGWQYGVPAYGIASAVAYSRVRSDNHHWRDVAAGALLATSVQYVVTGLNINFTKTLISPVIDKDNIGFNVTTEF
ncbi:phosphatase PAP2 family protein [Erwiniaceae bacterium BAC15a-03b]|uniref:Phosphatase PAP2 family protein n=1 Tax=Winslowiella arboricola TaxID=2978220 RepID=A0A9J6Q0K7_9GAMM|nr:phosphatase PAP2 family protein [Winslowiella arboricola]MCU5772416.1 phosphatase PAP2 family protein [Winslowiella arboricola]MCU5779791.1 phosphatase PAP2 family protein [Winslowiella arboricola]